MNALVRVVGWSLVLLFCAATVSIAGAQAPARVAKTGQQDCWNNFGGSIACAGTGQDGELQLGVAWPNPRFSDHGDGTATDHLTGLMWLQDVNCFGDVTWDEAFAEIASLNAGGESCLNYTAGLADWRMPNYRELQSVMAYFDDDGTLPPGNPFLNWVPCDGSCPGALWWTSTTHTRLTGFAFFLFLGGRGSASLKTGARHLWPVRGVTSGPAPVERTGQQDCWDSAGDPVDCAGTGHDGELQLGVAWPNPRFTDHGDGTVTDNLTGLMWLQDAGCFPSQQWDVQLANIDTFNAGSIACINYPGGQYDDWHLPNVKELWSLHDYRHLSDQLDLALPKGHPFLNVSFFEYFTSTSSVAGSYALVPTVEMNWDAETAPWPKNNNRPAWPVRLDASIFADGFESGDGSAWSGSVP